MKNKKFIILGIALVILIIITIFIVFNYKNIKSGNNMINKSEEDIKQYILNISSYEATMKIEVQTNKNKNKYMIKQKLQENTCTQEVLEPENIAGVITIYDGSNLKITNSKLDLSTTYENYVYIVNNNLWLNSFIKDFKENSNSKITSKENEIIFEQKDEEDNKYNVYKTLYVDKKTAKPSKMIIQDINKNTTIYILYTEIEIS